IGFYFYLSRDLPRLPQDLQTINLSLPTEIYSADGELIQILGERYPVPLEDVSPDFLKAIIAVEDAKFYQHHGLDHLGMIRALLANLRAGRIVQGGSTITQQLSKNLFFSFERNFLRKLKELLIALQLEATFTKDQILEAYVNQIYFGSGAYGVEEAAQVYFDKRAKDLTLLQAAVLAGLPNSPNNSNPFINLERAWDRTGYVLERMVRSNFITHTQKEEALGSELDLAHPEKESNPNLYFANFVVDKLEQEYGKEFVHFGGLKIYTTLNSRYQLYALKAARSHLEALEEEMPRRTRAEGPLQAALVAVENKTGAVRAMLGGRNYSLSQFNRAVSNNRLPGSSFKPFVYLTAMEVLDYHPATIVTDEPVKMDIPGGEPWEPKNFGGVFAGPLILKKALMRSINVISAKLVQKVTPQKVIETARQFGIQSPLGNNLSLGLGTSGVSPLEMAGAFSVIANLGIYNKPYVVEKIEDFHGNQVYQHYYQGVQRFSQKTLYPLLDMLRSVVDAGTGRVVRRMGFDFPAAGKTGTTNDYKDAWFDGFTKDLAVSVWVGYDNNDPMTDKAERGLTGARAAAPIWTFFMQKAHEGKNRVKFPVPSGIKLKTVDVRTGKLASPAAAETLTVAVREEVDLKPPPEESARDPLFPFFLNPEDDASVSVD
ncbi:MAG: PBP1A family penicillin-binding protein, partial [Nitrospinaceae bacterium]|nr:PBP1A family penicillin-binding protein [Nitrospinaceae bacterium]NIR55184.1 PBP1A family penicillin-binding protein [Nitrospinaceae bacterium]NIS85608.1 PBP1A family penicillin-binding protein [Nitrospinaceae bacterium]NIT82454.1 PBP1A family penicillin-binding protein [Nitrospinaceae bacterium]NIU44667.1 PBP1A family penicillin-binding protein [Nitrospinaceae bacterium]